MAGSYAARMAALSPPAACSRAARAARPRASAASRAVESPLNGGIRLGAAYADAGDRDERVAARLLIRRVTGAGRDGLSEIRGRGVEVVAARAQRAQLIQRLGARRGDVGGAAQQHHVRVFLPILPCIHAFLKGVPPELGAVPRDVLLALRGQ